MSGNASLSFTFRQTKTEVFEYTNVIQYITSGAPSYFYRFSVFMWTGERQLNTLLADAYFFENRENNLLFQKYRDTYGQGLTGDCCSLVYTPFTR